MALTKAQKARKLVLATCRDTSSERSTILLEKATRMAVSLGGIEFCRLGPSEGSACTLVKFGFYDGTVLIVNDSLIHLGEYERMANYFDNPDNSRRFGARNSMAKWLASQVNMRVNAYNL